MSPSNNSPTANALAQRWAAFAPRERALLTAAAVLIVSALLWWVGIAPALSTLRSAQAAAPALDAQLQVMRTQAQEAASLKAQRSLSYDESLRALEGSMKALGATASLTVSDSRANVSLRGTSGDALAQWLAQVRSNARLVPAELRVKKAANPTPAAPTPTAWDGSVVFNLSTR
jgi:general secretion pathway protein M